MHSFIDSSEVTNYLIILNKSHYTSDILLGWLVSYLLFYRFFDKIYKYFDLPKGLLTAINEESCESHNNEAIKLESNSPKKKNFKGGLKVFESSENFKN